MLTIIVPAHDEAAVLPAFHARLAAVLDTLPHPAEILFVDDGSRDATLSVIAHLRATDPRIAVLALSRNFGKEIAISAGLDHARGDAVVIIDADLQDPPELIPTLLARFDEGYDNVYAQRRSRPGDTALKRATAHGFYRVLNRLSEHPVPLDTGDYRLLSRRAVNALVTLRERHRFMKGLYGWVGFRQCAVPYDREPRAAGSSKWNYWRLWNFSLEGITSFSTAPLRITFYAGAAIATGALIYATYITLRTLLHGNPVAGYASLLVFVLFLGGIQLMSTGIIGEYLGRMFNEMKGRPLYVVDRLEPAGEARPGALPLDPAGADGPRPH